MIENYLDVDEAAELLEMHPESVRRLIRTKRLPGFKFHGKFLVEKHDVEKYKKESRLNRERAEEMLRLWDGGMNQTEIAERFNTSQSAVSAQIKRYLELLERNNE